MEQNQQSRISVMITWVGNGHAHIELVAVEQLNMVWC